MYVIQRTGHGGYATRPGSRASYTHLLQQAGVFTTRESAERERCTGNEIVLAIGEAMHNRSAAR